MTLYEVLYFIVHCIVHCFGYWLPCACGFCVDLLLCRPCRQCEKKKHGYAYHPSREVRLIHNADCVEAAVHVFGLMDVGASVREDRQCCTLGLTDAKGKASRAVKQHTRSHSMPQSKTGGVSLETTATTPAKPASPAFPSLTHQQPQQQQHSHDDQHQQPSLQYSPAELSLDATRESEATYNSQRYPFAAPSSMASMHPSERHTAAPARATTTTTTTVVTPTRPVAHGAAASAARAKAVDPTHEPAAPDLLSKKAYHKPTYASPPRWVQKEIKRCHLTYNSPLYGPHIGTILGAFRPQHHVAYIREEMQAWDGCVLAMDWYYVDGEVPHHYDHEHTSRVRQRSEHVSGGEEMTLHEPIGESRGDNAPRSHLKSTSPTFPHSTSDKAGAGAAAATAAAAADPAPANAASSSAVGVVFIVPGLTSYSQSNYVQHLVHALHKAQLHVCVLSTRGMGDTPPVTTPFLFNGAYTRDVRDCLQQYLTKDALAARLGRPLPVIGIGLSIGGIILSKYVGEEGIAGADPHLDALITCCSPMDYVLTVAHMNRNGAQRALYQRDMCNDVRNYLLRHEPLQRMPNVDNAWVFEQGNIHRFRRVLHFDEHVIAPSAGYRSVHHYHVDASAVTWLPYAPIPVLAISAADDPVIGRTVMPHRWREITRNNPRVVYAEPPVGGHLGFLSGPWTELRNRDNWMEVFVRARVLAACEYWRAVQRHAQEAARAAPVKNGVAAAAERVPPSGVLFSPTTDAVAAATHTPATVAAGAQNTNTLLSSAVAKVQEDVRATPALNLMRVVVTANTAPDNTQAAKTRTEESDVRSVHGKTDGLSAPGEAAVPSSAQHESTAKEHNAEGGVSPSALALSVSSASAAPAAATAAVPVSVFSSPETNKEPCFVDNAHNDHVLTSISVSESSRPAQGTQSSSQSPSAEKALTFTLNGQASSPTTFPFSSPRPVQYLPPREDRASNRCYFTYYCTPVVPPSRLQQPYFTQQTDDVDDEVERLSTSATCIDDGRSSMYASCRGNANINNNGGGRRRSLNPYECQSGPQVMGKDARCMMVTGQHTYPPVVVNCDYVVDPRTMMVED